MTKLNKKINFDISGTNLDLKGLKGHKGEGRQTLKQGTCAQSEMNQCVREVNRIVFTTVI